MLKLKHCVLMALTTGLLLIGASVTTNAQSENAARTEKIKAGITKLGTGTKSVAKVKLYSKTEYKGYVSRIGEDEFELVDAVGAAHVVRYSDVKSIGGKNLSTGAKIGIGVGIGAGITLLILALIISNLD